MSQIKQVDTQIAVATPQRVMVQRQAFNPISGVSGAIGNQLAGLQRDKVAADKITAGEQEIAQKLAAQQITITSAEATNAEINRVSANGLRTDEVVNTKSLQRIQLLKKLQGAGIVGQTLKDQLTVYDSSIMQVGAAKQEQVDINTVKYTDSLGHVSYGNSSPAESTEYAISQGMVPDTQTATYLMAGVRGQIEGVSQQAVMNKLNTYVAAFSEMERLKSDADKSKQLQTLVQTKYDVVLDTQGEIFTSGLLHGFKHPETGVEYPAYDPTKNSKEDLEQKLYNNFLSMLQTEPMASMEMPNGVSDSIKRSIRDTSMRTKAAVVADKIYTLANGAEFESLRNTETMITVARISGALSPEYVKQMKDMATSISQTYAAKGQGFGMDMAAVTNAEAIYTRIVKGDVKDPIELPLFRMSHMLLTGSMQAENKRMQVASPESSIFKGALDNQMGTFSNIVNTLEDGKPIVRPDEACKAIGNFLGNVLTRDDVRLALKKDRGVDGYNSLIANIKTAYDMLKQQTAVYDPEGSSVKDSDKKVDSFFGGYDVVDNSGLSSWEIAEENAQIEAEAGRQE